MWVRTVSGWRFFEVEYTQQGIPFPTKPKNKSKRPKLTSPLVRK